MQDSATTSRQILDNVDRLRRREQDECNENALSNPKCISRSTAQRALRKIVPKRIAHGGVQNSSRQRALMVPHNAISCAATWSAVTEDVDDRRQIHSWDELSIELNGFGKKTKLLLTSSGAAKLHNRNLHPSTTRNQGKRRTFKIGIRTFHHLNVKAGTFLINTLSFKCHFLDSNAEGEVECVIAIIKDDNFTRLKIYKVFVKLKCTYS